MLCLPSAAHPDVVEVIDGAKVDIDAEEDSVKEEQKEELVVVVADTVVHPGEMCRGGCRTLGNTGTLPALPSPRPLLPWAVMVHLEHALATGGAVVAAVRFDALAVMAPPHPAVLREGVHRQAAGHVLQDTLLIHTLHAME